MKKKEKANLGKWFKIPCPWCGAKAGEPCKTRNGVPVDNIIDIHVPRLNGNRKRDSLYASSRVYYRL